MRGGGGRGLTSCHTTSQSATEKLRQIGERERERERERTMESLNHRPPGTRSDTRSLLPGLWVMVELQEIHGGKYFIIFYTWL